MCSVTSHSPDETRLLGERLGAKVRPGDVIGLLGPLGAGKTCFVQGLARGLEVVPDLVVTSPTFTLVGEYPGRLLLRHADFYRVESYAQLEEIGFDDLLDPEAVLAVEWPERFPAALPVERLEVRIRIVSDTERRLDLSGVGGAAAAFVRRIGEAWP